jgi:hypothetical protein
MARWSCGIVEEYFAKRNILAKFIALKVIAGPEAKN